MNKFFAHQNAAQQSVHLPTPNTTFKSGKGFKVNRLYLERDRGICVEFSGGTASPSPFDGAGNANR